MQPRYCSQCGFEIEDISTPCPSCGRPPLPAPTTDQHSDTTPPIAIAHPVRLSPEHQPTTPPMPAQPAYPPENYALIASRQRMLIWICLLWTGTYAALFAMVAFPGYMFFPIFIGLVQLGMKITAMIISILLMSALRIHPVLIALICILLVVPCADLLTLLAINGSATQRLKRGGFRVGLLGVKKEDIRRILADDVCLKCGYLLTGNVSGICPECGTPIPLAGANRA